MLWGYALWPLGEAHETSFFIFHFSCMARWAHLSAAPITPPDALLILEEWLTFGVGHLVVNRTVHSLHDALVMTLDFGCIKVILDAPSRYVIPHFLMESLPAALDGPLELGSLVLVHVYELLDRHTVDGCFLKDGVPCHTMLSLMSSVVPPRLPIARRQKGFVRHNLKKAIEHARLICINFEDTPECRAAWETVSELTRELHQCGPSDATDT